MTTLPRKKSNNDIILKAQVISGEDIRFRNRSEAGKLLGQKLQKYKDKDAVVYALPRGGVVTALEIAKYLDAPLDLIITRKIGHPSQPEYAIAATAEDGYIVGEKKELKSINEEWLKVEIIEERKEAKRRRETYLEGREEVPVKGKMAILVDDGVATGLTLRVGIAELKHRQPKKIVVAVPVVSKDTANVITSEIDELVALTIPSNDKFLGAVGSYYREFPQITDENVITMLKSGEERRKKV